MQNPNNQAAHPSSTRRPTRVYARRNTVKRQSNEMPDEPDDGDEAVPSAIPYALPAEDAQFHSWIKAIERLGLGDTHITELMADYKKMGAKAGLAQMKGEMQAQWRTWAIGELQTQMVEAREMDADDATRIAGGTGVHPSEDSFKDAMMSMVTQLREGRGDQAEG